MLRVVADANVLISAALARSPEAPSVLTLDAALDGRVELITSPLLLREIASVLARPRLQSTSPPTRPCGSSQISPPRQPC
ncbi:MAG TPA: PIN domain-containing protein [Solirubrobacteraceae bacterium]|nr:PIN domain-containing protein [Solirubrobacteraceae bacterium]